MKKFWNIGSNFMGVLSLIILPMTGLIYKRDNSNYVRYFNFFKIIFGNKEYGIKFNILILLLLVIIISTGFISYIIKNKETAYLTTMLVYLFDIILLLFTKAFFFICNNSDYTFYKYRSNNSMGYGVLIGIVVCMVGAYFAYMSMVYEHEDNKAIKKNKK